ncbi:MAG: hypothetical protein IKV18_03225 [Alistipes sp.]|nr:hypothetical protein [Alistipes sp.]
MKRLLKNIMMLAAVAMAAVACQTDDISTEMPQPDDGMMRLRFGVQSPDMRQVNTRAVDPDGKGIQNITIFCFDGNGLFISTATARIEGEIGDDEVSLSGGIFDAVVPQATRVMHLLANQNMSTFTEDTFRAKSEDEVMSILEGSSGMMIYWARVAVPVNAQGQMLFNAKARVQDDPNSASKRIQNWLEEVTQNNPIIMLRNQAKVTVVASTNSNFEVTGFAVENTQAFGTVAPYHMEYKFPTYAHRNTESYTAWVPEFYVDREGEIANATKDDSGAVGAIPNGTLTNQHIHWHETHFITVPHNDSKLTNVFDVSEAAEVFVFETENSSGDPVNVIIKGKNPGETVEKYYRVTLTDANGEQVLIERNHHYKIEITGALSFGQDTFAEALTAPPTNNIWLSISDEVNEVQDQDFLLRVAQTDAVVRVNGNGTFSEPTSDTAWEVTEGGVLTLKFEVEDVNTSNSKGISTQDLQVSWLDGNTVSATNVGVSPALNFDTTSGEGTITLALNPLGQNDIKKEGTVLVKYGHLQRKIKVVTIREQKFEPIWVSTQVYGVYDGQDGTDRANVTLMFSVPETCPDELLPFEVMLSVNVLDVRSESGQTLPVIRADDPRYGADNGIGYKYVYTVKQKGTQRIYLESILNQANGSSDKLKIESPYFETAEKIFTFTSAQRAISLTNAIASNPNATDEAEKMYYILVPQKKGAPVVMNLQLKEGANNIEAGKYDEFLLYSENLDHYTDDKFSIVRTQLQTSNDAWMTSNYTTGTNAHFPCQFAPINETLWGTGGRVFAFTQRPAFSTINFTDAGINNVDLGRFSIYMQTNKAKCAEVVRISSNDLTSKAAFTTEVTNGLYGENTDDSKIYKEKGSNVYVYRSFVFELANYHPYRFMATVTGSGEAGNINIPHDESARGTESEEITNVTWTYVPNQKIDVAFDITDFKAADGTLVDPFGQAFEIYIHAPMLEIDQDRVNDVLAQKFYYDARLGCFVYKVEAKRADEENKAKDGNIKQDAILPNRTNEDATKGQNERKVLPFKTKGIVTEGQITISSNEEQVVYHSKTFNVQNASITGNVTYTPKDATEAVALPDKAFISFTRVANGSRIGSIEVSNDGSVSRFALRLRPEYEFSWQNDEVQLYYAVPAGEVTEEDRTYKVTNYYTATYSSLNALYQAMNGSARTVNLIYAGQNKMEIR